MKPEWHQNLILICEKCGKKMVPAGNANPSHELKDWLKKELKATSLWGENRVVTSSCLDICPEGKVAIAYVSDRPGLETFAEIINPDTERNRVFSTVLDRANLAQKQ